MAGKMIPSLVYSIGSFCSSTASCSVPAPPRQKRKAEKPTWTYIKHFMKDQGVASITPTSSFGVRTLMGLVDFKQDIVIAEYGPGTGVISTGLLNQMSAGSRLLLIERNPHFTHMLRQKYADARVIVREGSAEDVQTFMAEAGLEQADYVVSGIPFSLIPGRVREHIVAQTYAVLKPGGLFLAYQTPWQPDRHLSDHLNHHFEKVRSKIEMRNMPPLRIYAAQKHSAVLQVQVEI